MRQLGNFECLHQFVPDHLWRHCNYVISFTISAVFTGSYPASTSSVRRHPSTGVDSSGGCVEVQTPQTLRYLTLSVTAGVKHL